MRQQVIGAGLIEMMEALGIGSEEQLAALLLHSGCSAECEPDTNGNMYQNFALHTFSNPSRPRLGQTIPRSGIRTFGLQASSAAACLKFRVNHELKVRRQWWALMLARDALLIKHGAIPAGCGGTDVFEAYKPTRASVLEWITTKNNV